jgi:hypothetical protein
MAMKTGIAGQNIFGRQVPEGTAIPAHETTFVVNSRHLMG